MTKTRDRFGLFVICMAWLLWLDYSYASADDTMVASLQEIHTKYKRIIVPEWQLEKTMFGSKGEPVEKQWQILLKGGKGDCDDYAATFRAAVMLKHPGVKTWLYIGKRFGGYHAIAVVDINGVKYQMDNTRDKVIPLDQSMYDWTHVWEHGKPWVKYRKGEHDTGRNR